MTKEEALKVFRSYTIWDLMDNFTTDEIQEMIDAIVSQPSLPSNLDDAAEEYAKGEGLENALGGWEDMSDAFKSGAEWMAGQGVSLSHLMAWYIQSVDAHEPVWTKEHLEELVKDYILIPKN